VTDDAGTKVAEVWQTGYRCHHATRSMTVEELKAGGYTHVRVTGYLDVDDLCPACKAARPPRPRRTRTPR